MQSCVFKVNPRDVLSLGAESADYSQRCAAWHFIRGREVRALKPKLMSGFPNWMFRYLSPSGCAGLFQGLPYLKLQFRLKKWSCMIFFLFYAEWELKWRAAYQECSAEASWTLYLHRTDHRWQCDCLCPPGRQGWVVTGVIIVRIMNCSGV